ncbi:MAG: hypothetical protein IPP72_12870 [Chitinophagaceae bacterium]|nr:hypothetical protein [Chitinophagaceae bacterium]
MSSTDFEILPIHLWQEPVSDPFLLLRSHYGFMDTAATMLRLRQLCTAAFDEEYCPWQTIPALAAFLWSALRACCMQPTCCTGKKEAARKQ